MRLALFTSKHFCCQITITKTYSNRPFLEDVCDLHFCARQKSEHATFMFTDADVVPQLHARFR